MITPAAAQVGPGKAQSTALEGISHTVCRTPRGASSVDVQMEELWGISKDIMDSLGFQAETFQRGRVISENSWKGNAEWKYGVGSATESLHPKAVPSRES